MTTLYALIGLLVVAALGFTFFTLLGVPRALWRRHRRRQLFDWRRECPAWSQPSHVRIRRERYRR